MQEAMLNVVHDASGGRQLQMQMRKYIPQISWATKHVHNRV